MKKIIGAVFLFFIIFASASAVSARTYTASPYRNLINNYDEAYTAIYEAVAGGADYADITDLKISSNDIGKIYSDILQSCPEFFYLNTNFKYYYIDRGLVHYVTKVEFRYIMTRDEIIAASDEYEKELAYIVSLVDTSMNDAEKALWVHDYLIASYEYDTTENIFDAYNFFKERKGVCQAYSLAYMAVLRELGIEAFMITSPEMNHAWNIVYLRGKWYHADLLFDDPTPDRCGRVLHENFLLSDEEIKNTPNPHYGWKSKFTCDSDEFSDSFWRDVNSRMVYVDLKWYYVDGGNMTLMSADYDSPDNSYVIYEFDEKWYVEGYTNRYWSGAFSGVSDFLGYIFVNTPYEIITYSTQTGRINTYYELDGAGKIFGSNIYKNGLEYLVSISPDVGGGERHIERFEMKDLTQSDLIKKFPFEDVSRLDYSYAPIRYVYNNNLFTGVSSDRFAPGASLTRAMFVTVLGRLCNIEPENYSGVSFSDVQPGLWYSPYVEWACSEGIVNGVGEDIFNPIGEITHEQMYKIIAYCGKMLSCDIDSDELPMYADMDKLSEWAVDSVNYCVRNHLIPAGSENEYLNPADKSTREEAAVIIYNLAKLINAA